MQPFPREDQDRIKRVVQDVADLLQMGELDFDTLSELDEQNVRKIKRWVGHVLRKAQGNRKWWFLTNASPFVSLLAGQDMIDLKGHLDRVSAVYAPKRLHQMPLEELIGLRLRAKACNASNAGEPTHYALEAGRRVHLWPAPAVSTPFVTVYQRPIHIAIVPPEWETIVLDGVLGMYGRHFDKNQMAHDPEEFERRFTRALRGASIESHDLVAFRTWDDRGLAASQLVANSSTDTATEVLVPASIQGVGFELVLSSGDYLLVDNGKAPFGDENYVEVV